MAVLVTTVEAKVSLGLQLVTLELATYRNGPHNHFPGLPVPPATSRCHSLRTKPEGPQFPLPHLFLAACRVVVSGLSGFVPVPGLSPQGPLPGSSCHFRGHWPVWACLGTMLYLPKVPERRLQPCPRLGYFLCKSKNRPLHKPTGLKLSQSHGPATSASCVFIGILTSSGPPVWASDLGPESCIGHPVQEDLTDGPIGFSR